MLDIGRILFRHEGQIILALDIDGILFRYESRIILILDAIEILFRQKRLDNSNIKYYWNYVKHKD